MVAGGVELDSAGVGLGRARGGMEELWGEARGVGARGIEAGRRGWPAQGPAMSSARFGLA